MCNIISLFCLPCKIFSELNPVYLVWVDSPGGAHRGYCGDIWYLDFTFNEKKSSYSSGNGNINSKETVNSKETDVLCLSGCKDLKMKPTIYWKRSYINIQKKVKLKTTACHFHYQSSKAIFNEITNTGKESAEKLTLLHYLKDGMLLQPF